MRALDEAIARHGLAPFPHDPIARAGGTPHTRAWLRGQYSLLRPTLAHAVRMSNLTLPQGACTEGGHRMVALTCGHWKMAASLGMDEARNRVSVEVIDRPIGFSLERYGDSA